MRVLILDSNRESTVSVAINVICTTIISMSMVHFVFEMELLRTTGEERRIKNVRIMKAVFIAFLVIHALVFDFSRVVWDFGRDIGTAGEVFMVFPGILKVISDVCTYYFFIKAFSFLI